MTYIIAKNGDMNKPLSYFYANGNFKIKDIIGFGMHGSNKSFTTFSTKEEAQDYIEMMKQYIKERNKGRFDIETELIPKMLKIFDKLQIKEYLK